MATHPYCLLQPIGAYTCWEKEKEKEEKPTQAEEYEHRPQGGLQKILRIILERKWV